MDDRQQFPEWRRDGMYRAHLGRNFGSRVQGHGGRVLDRDFHHSAGSRVQDDGFQGSNAGSRVQDREAKL